MPGCSIICTRRKRRWLWRRKWLEQLSTMLTEFSGFISMCGGWVLLSQWQFTVSPITVNVNTCVMKKNQWGGRGGGCFSNINNTLYIQYCLQSHLLYASITVTSTFVWLNIYVGHRSYYLPFECTVYSL